MFATEHRVTGGSQFLADNASRAHVTGNDFLSLLPTNRAVNCLGGTLRHVAHAIKLGALATIPHGAEL